MRALLIALLVLVLSPTTRAQTAPANPITIETEIGSVGSGNAPKTIVASLVKITKQDLTYFIKLGGNDAAREQAMLEIPEAKQSELIAAIEKMRPLQGDMKATAAGYLLSAATSQSSGVRTISIQDEKQLFPVLQVRLDPDETDAVLGMMKKAQGVQAWLKARAEALKL